MNINELIATVKKKIQNNIDIKKIEIEDKTFLHKNHLGNQKGKFHIKLIIESDELKNINKKIYKVLEKELKDYIHSIQILLS